MYQPFCAEDKEKNRFSTVWKHSFHGVEIARPAHGFAEGKFRFGTRAKRGPKPNREKVFHGVENRNYHL